MKSRTQLLILSIFYISFLTMVIFKTTYSQIDITQSNIKNKLSKTVPSLLVIDSDTLYAQSQIRLFYQYHNYSPIWTKFTLTPTGLQELIDIIEQSSEDGFNPMDYHLVKIKAFQKEIIYVNQQKTQTPLEIANIDILISDAFLTLALHNYAGRIRSKGLNHDWGIFFKELSLIDFLHESIQKNNLKLSLNSLKPPYQEYHHLQKVLIQYQKKAALIPDSISLNDHISKIIINMERWRWVSKSTDSVYIIVNIPAYRLWLYHYNTIIMSMKIIVGKRSNPTPSFNSKISYIVLRPQWNIPISIMKNEILPEVLKDTSYLSKNNIEIYHNWNGNTTNTISPNSIAWDTVNINHFPYKLIQSASSVNPLGEIKFMFPNQFNVYLHDTPFKSHLI